MSHGAVILSGAVLQNMIKAVVYLNLNQERDKAAVNFCVMKIEMDYFGKRTEI